MDYKSIRNLYTVPIIMLILAICMPQAYVVALNIIELILFAIHCVICYYEIHREDIE